MHRTLHVETARGFAALRALVRKTPGRPALFSLSVANTKARAVRHSVFPLVWYLVRVGSLIAGVGLSALGLAIARIGTPVTGVPQAVLDALSHHFMNADSMGLGVGLGVLGAGFLAASCRNVIPERITSHVSTRLRLDLSALFAMLLAILLFAHLSFSLVWHEYTHSEIAVFFATLSLAGFAIHRLTPTEGPTPGLYNRWDWIVVIALATVALLLGSIELVSWRFAYVGDEGMFFEAASRIVQNTEAWSFFNLLHVYGSHPATDSLIHAAGMKLLGLNVIGWRFSEVAMTAMATGGMYLLGTVLLGRGPGVIAAVMLASNHYLMALNRTGYNNAHPIVFAVATMLMVVLYWRTRRAVFSYATGVAAGLCLYTFEEALFTWAILAVLVAIDFARRPWRQPLVHAAVMLLGFALTVTPALIATPPTAIAAMVVTNSGGALPAADRADLAINSLVRSPATLWVNRQWVGPYIGGPMLDPVMGAFLWCGIAIALSSFWRPSRRLLLVWLFASFMLIALTSHSPQPSFTRLIFVLPPAALLAAIGLWSVAVALHHRLRIPESWRLVPVALILGTLPWLNFYQLLVDSPRQLPPNGAMLVIRALQEHPSWNFLQVVNDEEPITETVVRWYPWLAKRYLQVNAQTFERIAGSPNASTFVYLVDAADSVRLELVRARLGVGYRSTELSNEQFGQQIILFRAS